MPFFIVVIDMNNFTIRKKTKFFLTILKQSKYNSFKGQIITLYYYQKFLLSLRNKCFCFTFIYDVKWTWSLSLTKDFIKPLQEKWIASRLNLDWRLSTPKIKTLYLRRRKCSGVEACFCYFCLICFDHNQHE